jgi:hypothetical protein
MTRKIPFVQEATLSLLDPREGPRRNSDEYSVLSIGKRSRQLLSFTHDQHDLERRLPLLLTATNESTALFDGIWLRVSTARQEAANQRRAMIIITDGGDNHSRYNLAETRRLLEEADVPVFVVMAGPSFELPTIFLPQEKKRNRLPAGKGNLTVSQLSYSRSGRRPYRSCRTPRSSQYEGIDRSNGGWCIHRPGRRRPAAHRSYHRASIALSVRSHIQTNS